MKYHGFGVWNVSHVEFRHLERHGESDWYFRERERERLELDLGI